MWLVSLKFTLSNLTICTSSSSVSAMHLPELPQMGFQDTINIYSGSGYQRFQSEIDTTSDPGGRCSGKVSSAVVSPRSSSKRLKSCCISTVLLPKKAFELCGEIMNRMKLEGVACPSINFSSQWGLPVLSHPSVGCKDRLTCKWALFYETRFCDSFSWLNFVCMLMLLLSHRRFFIKFSTLCLERLQGMFILIIFFSDQGFILSWLALLLDIVELIQLNQWKI